MTYCLSHNGKFDIKLTWIREQMSSEQPLKPVRIVQGGIISQVSSAYKQNGLNYIISKGPSYVKSILLTTLPNLVSLLYFRMFRSAETFEFQGNHYHYLFHAYCPTWRNERAAIIPIAWEFVQKYQRQNKEILEVGNMLSYVFPVNHDILDKYEVTDSVINEDVVDFNSSKKYDLIISILTLQWAGLNESPKEGEKAVRAIQNLMRNLAPGGELVIIHGFGENLDMDKLIATGTIAFDKSFYLKRVIDYRWEEATWEDIEDTYYNHSIPTANGVMIGIIEKDSELKDKGSESAISNDED